MNVVIGDEDKGLRRHDEGAWAYCAEEGWGGSFYATFETSGNVIRLGGKR